MFAAAAVSLALLSAHSANDEDLTQNSKNRLYLKSEI